MLPTTEPLFDSAPRPLSHQIHPETMAEPALLLLVELLQELLIEQLAGQSPQGCLHPLAT